MPSAARGVSIGGNHPRRSDAMEWLTPPAILQALGRFDLDPCSPVDRPWSTADRHYTVMDNGLMMPWHGRVWCNPPYGDETALWLARCAMHCNATALVFARTETAMFFDHVWDTAEAMLFIRSRLHFRYPDGTRAQANAGGPSVLIAWGRQNWHALHDSGLPGKFIDLRGSAASTRGKIE